LKNENCLYQMILGIVSFDESEAVVFFYLPATYINRPTDHIVKESVGIILRQLDSDGNGTRVKLHVGKKVIDAQLVIRRSS
jgi:DNA-binding LacI/PurR family transcriptional regulator